VKISVRKGILAQTKSEAIILPLFEEEKKLSGLARQVDEKHGCQVTELIRARDF
jgi:leucyl aminopeptidase